MYFTEVAQLGLVRTLGGFLVQMNFYRNEKRGMKQTLISGIQKRPTLKAEYARKPVRLYSKKSKFRPITLNDERRHNLLNMLPTPMSMQKSYSS